MGPRGKSRDRRERRGPRALVKGWDDTTAQQQADYGQRMPGAGDASVELGAHGERSNHTRKQVCWAMSVCRSGPLPTVVDAVATVERMLSAVEMCKVLPVDAIFAKSRMSD
jgi:hypothetical protein